MYNRGIALVVAAAGMAGITHMGGRPLDELYPPTPIRREHHRGRTCYGLGGPGSRSCYAPHQGEQEVERRLRQAARNEQRQRERAESVFMMGRLSRRGYAVPREC